MAYLLLMDTAEAVGSIALMSATNGEVVYSAQNTDLKSHAVKIPSLIQEGLKALSIDMSSIEAVSISTGPGSYTGLRIGFSLAKGICLGGNIPLIGIPTLTAIKEGILQQVSTITHHKTLIAPMMDARRMEVYTAFFDEKGQLLKAPFPHILGEETFRLFESYGVEKVILAGSGAAKLQIPEQLPYEVTVLDKLKAVKADFQQKLALEKWKAGEFEDLFHFEPLYLKEFQAKPSTKIKKLLNL